MELRTSLTRRNIIIGISILLIGLVVAGFFALRRPPRVAMERYVPADALAFVEIDSLADLVDGLSSTTAWRELAPVLSLSSQLKQIGFLADVIGRTGLGPDEAVVAGRAQCAVAITGIESNAGETDEGPYIHFRPHFALIIETHMKPGAAARLVRERTSIIAERIFGQATVQESQHYRDTELLIFHGPEPGRQLLAASAGSAVLIANQAAAMESCLDAIAGRASTLAEDSTLAQTRPEVDRRASIFAYVTESGIKKLVELWPALLGARSGDPDNIVLFGDLIEHLSKQAGASLFYSSHFERGGVTDKYLTVLRPQVAAALADALKPASAANFESLALVPREVERLTILSVDRAGESPERVLKHLAPVVDIVAAVALREFVISFRKQYGLDPADRVGDAIGSEIAVVSFGDDQSRAMLLRVDDKTKLSSIVEKYLTRNGGSVTREEYGGSEIMISSAEDRRAAGFVGKVLVLGTRDQIVKIIEANAEDRGIDRDERLKQLVSARAPNASILSYRPRVDDAAKLLLGISKLTRVTDGSPELLEGEPAHKALDKLPRTISFTEFRSNGVFVETHSAVGIFSLLASLMSDDEGR
jgi:hypothetical protein